MPDRNDPSQYPQQTTGEAFYGDTTMDDVQLQLSASGHYAPVDQLVDYVDPGTFSDPIFNGDPAFTTNRKLDNEPLQVRTFNYNGRGATANIPLFVTTGRGEFWGAIVYAVAGSGSYQPAYIAALDGIDAAAPVIHVSNDPANFGGTYPLSLGIPFDTGLCVNIVGVPAGAVPSQILILFKRAKNQ